MRAEDVDMREDVKPWFAPRCRQGPHPLIGHHAAMRRLCDCPCHETDGPWWSETKWGEVDADE
jgi:hypothetical protein